VVADGCYPASTDADLIISGKWGAPGLARNAAAPYIGSEWVGFLDDDDELLPNEYRATIEAHADADVVIMSMDDPDLGIIPRPQFPIIHGNVGISFAMKADLFREQQFIAGPPFTMRGEDFELLRRLMDQNRCIVATPTVTYRVLPEVSR